MLVRFKTVYSPDFILPAILHALSVTHRVGGRCVSVGGLPLVSDSTGLSIHELVLTAGRLRGVEILKKYAKDKKYISV